jgi:hypothetical protein
MKLAILTFAAMAVAFAQAPAAPTKEAAAATPPVKKEAKAHKKHAKKGETVKPTAATPAPAAK